MQVERGGGCVLPNVVAVSLAFTISYFAHDSFEHICHFDGLCVWLQLTVFYRQCLGVSQRHAVRVCVSLAQSIGIEQRVGLAVRLHVAQRKRERDRLRDADFDAVSVRDTVR